MEQRFTVFADDEISFVISGTFDTPTDLDGAIADLCRYECTPVAWAPEAALSEWGHKSSAVLRAESIAAGRLIDRIDLGHGQFKYIPRGIEKTAGLGVFDAMEAKERTRRFAALDQDALWNDEGLYSRLRDMRGGCSCHISPPCGVCSDPLTEDEAEELGLLDDESHPNAPMLNGLTREETDATASVMGLVEPKSHVQQLRELVEVQGRDGIWNYDGYMCGMFNGMELALAILEGRDPQYRTLKAAQTTPEASAAHPAIAGLTKAADPDKAVLKTDFDSLVLKR